jgi:hypothetical protein
MHLDPKPPRRRSHRARRLLLVALLLSLCLCAAACGDQTEQANKLVAEMNALVVKGEGLARQGAAKESELEAKDVEKERDAVRALAREQAALFKQGADAMREAAAKAEEASRFDLADWYKNYLALKARQHRKGAEILDAAIERAELLAGDQPFQELDEKMDASAERVARLSKEEDAIVAEVKKIEEEHKADFKP